MRALTEAPHASQLPQWSKLAGELAGEAGVGQINLERQPGLRWRFRKQVRGFPSMLLFRDGKSYFFTGERDVDALRKFVRGEWEQSEAGAVADVPPAWEHLERWDQARRVPPAPPPCPPRPPMSRRETALRSGERWRRRTRAPLTLRAEQAEVATREFFEKLLQEYTDLHVCPAPHEASRPPHEAPPPPFLLFSLPLTLLYPRPPPRTATPPALTSLVSSDAQAAPVSGRRPTPLPQPRPSPLLCCTTHLSRAAARRARRAGRPPRDPKPPPLVLIGHAASLTPY